MSSGHRPQFTTEVPPGTWSLLILTILLCISVIGAGLWSDWRSARANETPSPSHHTSADEPYAPPATTTQTEP